MVSTIEQAILQSCDKLFPSVIDSTREMVKQHAALDRKWPVLELDLVERYTEELGLPVQRGGIDPTRPALQVTPSLRQCTGTTVTNITWHPPSTPARQAEPWH